MFFEIVVGWGISISIMGYEGRADIQDRGGSRPGLGLAWVERRGIKKWLKG